jgi:hypothetical protein
MSIFPAPNVPNFALIGITLVCNSPLVKKSKSTRAEQLFSVASFLSIQPM